MRLYSGTSEEFIQDTVQNQVVDKLTEAYERYYGHRANPSEVTSWTNSLQFLKTAIQESALHKNMVVLEAELPYSNLRIDCLLFGEGINGKENVVVIELKQWSNVEDCDIEKSVRLFVAGANRIMAHPSYQVQAYTTYLKDFVEVFAEPSPVNLSSCVYCHNYSKRANPVLFLPKFKEALEEAPIFAKEDVQAFGDYLKERLGKGNGLQVFNRYVQSNIRPSKKLLEHTRKTISGEPAFNLIDDQLSAYYTILDRARKCATTKKKSVIIVRGGPGTGKSVIAINVLAELLAKGQTVFHATGSAAFTSTLRRIVGSRAAQLFKYFNGFQESVAKENGIDVLICDEAHRIRKHSNSRYMRRELWSNTPQIEELVRAAKVSIFFIDDYQGVRPDEIGSTQLIKETAEKFGAEVFDFELKTQFRCSGSDGYLNWIDDILGIRDTANKTLTKDEKMEFKIFESPQALFEAIKKKNVEKPNSARMVAGFCWPWSDANADGTLKEDVVIGDFKMTWEAKNEATKLAPGIPLAKYWAHDPNGVNQMGSIYTIQGFEFEYVGVVFGKDLIYDSVKKALVGVPANSADNVVKRSREDFIKYVKNAYRVLLTRGMRGCYVYFMDKETENLFRSRIQNSSVSNDMGVSHKL